MSDHGLIPPHGGKLINLVVELARAVALKASAERLPRIQLGEREQCDLELLAIGALSPLTGFMGEADFHSVCDTMKLTSGLPWSVPILCPVDRATADKLAIGQTVALTDDRSRLLAVLTVKEKYAHDNTRRREGLSDHDTAQHSARAYDGAGRRVPGGPARGPHAAARPRVRGPAPDAGADAGGVRGARLGDGGRVSDAQPDSPGA
jgi:sulfate adenylyltransferase